MTEKFQHFYMNSAEVLDSAFGIYKKSFWEQLLLSFVFNYGVSIIIFIPLFFLYIVFFSSIVFGTVLGGLGAISSAVWLAVFFIVLVVIFIINLIQGIVLTGNFFMTKQVFYGEKKSLGKAFSSAFKSIPRCLGAIVAKSLAGLTPCVFLIPIASSFTMGVFADGAVALILICLVLFILSCLFLDVLFIYAFPVAINEKITFFRAMKKGVLLLKGSFWRTSGVIMIMAVLLNVFQLSVTYGIQFAIVFLSESLDNIGLIIFLTVFQYLISFVFGALIGPVSKILTSVLYFNQKIKKDGLDIEINLKRLEGELQ